MTSIRSSLLATAVAALKAANVVDGSIYRGREQPFAREEMPAINVSAYDEQPTPFSKRVDQVKFVFKFEIYVRGDPWDVSADEIASQASIALMNAPDVIALCDDLRHAGTSWDSSNADLTAGKLTQRYRATFLVDSIDSSIRC